MACETFAELDKALGEYYKSMKKDDYFDGDGKGKFLLYCEENGFEADDMQEEFDNDAGDCMYIEFDPDDFPLADKINDDDERGEAIFAIIKHCYANQSPPSDEDDEKKVQFEKVLDIDLNTDEKTKEDCSAAYLKHCGMIYKEEVTLRDCYAIGYKNKYPFLIHLVDSYMRDKMTTKMAKGNKDLTMAEWQKNSPYLKDVANKKKKTVAMLTSGVESFIKRACPAWQFDTNNSALSKIEDSMQNIMEYLAIGSTFVQYLLEQKKTAPFQFDMVIAVKGIKNTSEAMAVDMTDSEDDDDGGGDDGDAGDDMAAGPQIGKIEDKLAFNKLPSHKIKLDRKELSDQTGMNRKLGQEWNTFKAKAGDKNYPHKKRFCAFVDRRNDDGDEFTFFSPKDAAEFSDPPLPEWYFNSSKTSLIPAGKGQEDTATIRADTGMNGTVMTFSFHVEQADEVRCYLYWNGKFTRVYPQDLDNIMGLIFVDDFENKKFKNNAKAKNAIYENMSLKDTKFEAFFREVSTDKNAKYFQKK